MWKRIEDVFEELEAVERGLGLEELLTLAPVENPPVISSSESASMLEWRIAKRRGQEPMEARRLAQGRLPFIENLFEQELVFGRSGQLTGRDEALPLDVTEDGPAILSW